MLRAVRIVFAKEARDNLRDRRTVLMSLIYPLLGPLVLGLLVVFVGRMLTSPATQAFQVWMDGSERAPTLVAYIEELGATVREAADDPALMVKAGAAQVVVVVPEDFEHKLAAQNTARIQVVVDTTRLSSIMTLSKTLDMLQRYGRLLGAQRLEALSINPEVSQPIRIETVNIAPGRNIAAIFLNMLPPFLMFAVFIGGVYLAIDTTAGERERGSLEPLLTLPVPRWQLMLGKFIASLLFTGVAVVGALFAYKLMFVMVGAAKVGITVNPDAVVFVRVFLVILPVMAFAVALQVVIATVTRSFKETQTYLGLLPLIPSAPGIVMVFVPVSGSAWLMLVPTLGQSVLIGQLMRGEPVDPVHVIVSAIATLAATIVILFVAAHFYDREQVAFPA
jgi:sodium transport system permease protein